MNKKIKLIIAMMICTPLVGLSENTNSNAMAKDELARARIEVIEDVASFQAKPIDSGHAITQHHDVKYCAALKLGKTAWQNGGQPRLLFSRQLKLREHFGVFLFGRQNWGRRTCCWRLSRCRFAGFALRPQ